MLLCDAAQVAEGKLFVLGGGWNQVQAETPANMALAVVVAVPWDEANRQHRVAAVLVTEDGEPVVVNERPVVSEGVLEVGRPPGVKPGSPLNVPVPLTFLGLQLSRGGYVWELRIDDTVEARAPFRAA